MSCHIVSIRHIHLLVEIIHSHPTEEGGRVAPAELSLSRMLVGNSLICENNASYNHRYNMRYADECHNPMEYEYEPSGFDGRMEDPYFALDQIDYYEYQACEHPDWEMCWVKRELDRIRACILAAIPGRPIENRTRSTWGVDEYTDPVTLERDGLGPQLWFPKSQKSPVNQGI
jgi:hypothetical protein